MPHAMFITLIASSVNKSITLNVNTLSLFPCPNQYDPPFPQESTLFRLVRAIVCIAPHAI